MIVKIEVAESLDDEWTPGPALNVIESNDETETLRAVVNAGDEMGFARLVLTLDDL